MVRAKKDYTKGKIYRLVCNTTGLQYIGHTTKEYLSQRLAKHVDNYKQWMKNSSKEHYITSFLIIEMGNYDIVLIEKFPCCSEDELKARERYWIENTDCVNKNVPNRGDKEYMKEWRENHKERVKEYKKTYRQENVQKISEYSKEVVKCECGTELQRINLSKHRKTQKHQDLLKTLIT